MSISLGGDPTVNTNAAQISYDTDVKLAYQGGFSGGLRSKVTFKGGVVGATHDFRRMGQAAATQHTSSELLSPAGYQHTKIPASLSNWRIGDYTDLFDQAETTVDERAQLAKSNAASLVRAEDQLVIDALDAATSIAGTVDEDLGGTDSSLNATKLRRAKRLLIQQQVAGGDHQIVVNAAALEGALAETQVTSSDFQSFKALVDGNLDGKRTFGFMWTVLEDRVEGGLPLGSASIRLNFAFDRSAVGLACGLEPSTRVDFIAERYSWLSQGVLKCGSAVIDPKGVVEIQTYEA